MIVPKRSRFERFEPYCHIEIALPVVCILMLVMALIVEMFAW